MWIALSRAKGRKRVWNTEVVLVNVEEEVNENGFSNLVVTSEVTVLSNRLPVYSSEFYGSSKEGYKIDKAYEVNAIEYSGETHVKVSGETYKVQRVFEGERYVELYCEKLSKGLEGLSYEG